MARLVGIELLTVLAPAWFVLLGEPAFDWSTAAGLVACALLPARHLWPPLAVLGGLWGLAGGLGWPAALVSLYTLGRRGGRMAATVPWLALVVVAAVAPVLLTQQLPWNAVVLTVAFVVLWAGAPAVMGLLVATRERLTESVAELRRARETALAARENAARACERARVGREIHDAVGHHATLIAVGAAALAVSTAEPETRAAADRLRVLAKRALAEMRAALGLIDGRTEPVAGATELAALVERARAAGVEVDLAHVGEQGEVPAGLGRAVYRVVQESLTNAARHAPGASVRVRLTWAPRELRVAVVNAAPARPGWGRVAAFGQGGLGLAGLEERVVSVGGALSAGPSGDGGFTLAATFPLVPAGTVRSPAAGPPG